MSLIAQSLKVITSKFRYATRFARGGEAFGMKSGQEIVVLTFAKATNPPAILPSFAAVVAVPVSSSAGGAAPAPTLLGIERTNNARTTDIFHAAITATKKQSRQGKSPVYVCQSTLRTLRMLAVHQERVWSIVESVFNLNCGMPKIGLRNCGWRR
jgi:hypothetical protein